MRARNMAEIIESFREAIIPSQSLTIATSDGDIGYLAMGRLPIRGNGRMGAFVKDGSLKEHDWIGYVPFEDQPRAINPKRGYIVNANNKIASDNMKWQLSLNQYTSSRAYRITQVLEEDYIKRGIKITDQDMTKLQLDTLDVIASELYPQFINQTRQYLVKNQDEIVYLTSTT